MQKAALSSSDILKLKKLQPEGWPDIIPYFQFYRDSPFCFPLKIVDNSTIVGIGTTIHHKSSAWVAHIIAHPNFRNQGIGRFVTKSLIDTIDRERFPTISLIATPLGEPVYLKAGFRREGEYLFFKNENYTDIPEENFNIMEATPDVFEKILAMDQKCSGEDRSALLEPHLKKVKIFRQKDVVSGFYAPTLGEGLVIAENEIAGIALLKQKLRALPFTALPAENEEALNFLLASGFQQFMKGTRMVLGQNISFKKEMLYGRIGGNLG